MDGGILTHLNSIDTVQDGGGEGGARLPGVTSDEDGGLDIHGDTLLRNDVFQD